MYTNNDILFPYSAIPSLRAMRGQAWQTLVERIAVLPESHEETIAFMLMMVRINGCMACETDSYRAMRGCASCAQQSIRRWKGDDEELLDLFRKALSDVRKFALANVNLPFRNS